MKLKHTRVPVRRAFAAFMSICLTLTLVPAPSGAAFAEPVTAGAGQDDAAVINPEDEDAAAAATDDAADQGEKPDASQTQDEPQGVEASEAPEAADASGVSNGLLGAPSNAPLAAQPAVYVNGTTGSDTAEGAGSQEAPYKTLAAAISAARAAGVTTIVAGGSLADKATIPSGLTLEVASETATTVDLTIANGATLKVDEGATLNVSGAAVLTVNGTVEGWGKANRAINVTTTSGKGLGWSSSAVFRNVSVYVDSNGENQAGFTAVNSTIETHGLWGYYAGIISLDNSTWTVDGDKWGSDSAYSGQGMSIAEGGGLNMANGSLLKVSNIHGRSWRGGQGISVGSGAKDFSIVDSTLEFENCATSGLNLNSSSTTVTLKNSTIKGSGQSGALYGVQKGKLVFLGSGLVETPASSDADTGAGPSGTYVVTGGSFLQTYNPSYYSAYGSIRPTNGADHGDEQLSLFTLSDASVVSLAPVDCNGASYTYEVASASSDGQKHVWVPAENVTFVLNDKDAAEQVSATFADGSTEDQVSQAIRGYGLSAASRVEGARAELPADPVALGYVFDGWYYKDAAGTEQKFDGDVAVAAPMTVYAKWQSDSESYGVVYHTNLSDDAKVTTSASAADRSINVLSLDQVTKLSSAFNVTDRDFVGWNTEPDGSGDDVAPGPVVVPTGVAAFNLYAQWADRSVSVSFSANGGTFADDSVFKKNPDVFDIVLDGNGGEVAVVKKKAVVSERMTLDALLRSASDGAVRASTAGIQTPVNTSTGASAPDAFVNIATRAYRVLDEKIETTGFWIFRSDDHYFWYGDAAGSAVASMDGALTEDTTYYLKWKNAEGIEDVKASTALPADLTSRGGTSSVLELAMSGSGYHELETADVVGVLDVTSILDQMDAIEERFGDRENIALDETTSVFTAELTMPAGMTISEDATVVANLGEGDLFVASVADRSSDKVTVRFSLNPDLDLSTYEKLYDAVEALVTTHDGKLTVTVSSVELDDSAALANGQKLTVTGKVAGSFDAYATKELDTTRANARPMAASSAFDAYATNESGTTKHFSFTWTGAQTKDGQDPEVPNAIAQTYQVFGPTNSVLNADILVGAETEHNQVYPVLVGQTVDYTGALDVSSIVDQMHGVELLYPGVSKDEYGDITLSNMTSVFTATFKVPEGLQLPNGLTTSDIMTEGFADTFAVSGVSYSDDASQITITMTLRDGIQTYQELFDAVSACGDSDGLMKVTVPGVLVQGADADKLTVYGEVEGAFVGTATRKDTVRHFWFTWNGKQTNDGSDFVFRGVAEKDMPISFTVAPSERDGRTLPGDLRILDVTGSIEDTESEAVYMTSKGAVHSYVGALKMDAVWDQMKEIEAEYQGVTEDDFADIALSDINFGFTARLDLPAGLSFSEALDPAVVTLEDASGFVVDDVAVSDDGKSAVVEFGIGKNIANYAELRDLVMGAGDEDGWMRIVVPGVKVADDVADNSQLTARGYVEGSFSARATFQGITKVFGFDWVAEQWAPGADALYPDSKDIQLTVAVPAADNPAQPDQPKPAEPGASGKGISPKTGDSLALGLAASAAAVAGGVALVVSRRFRRED